jgi:hypothetical protein
MGQNARSPYQVTPDVGNFRFVPGRWYPAGTIGVAAGAVLAASTIALVPFVVRDDVRISQLGARITTLAAGGNVQLAIYAAHINTLAPTGQALAKTGNLATDAAGNVAGALVGASPVTLPPGLYWFAINADASAGGTVIMQAAGANSPIHGNMIGSATQANISSATGVMMLSYTFAQTYGTWPDLTGVTFTEATGQAHAAGQFLTA